MSKSYNRLRELLTIHTFLLKKKKKLQLLSTRQIRSALGFRGDLHGPKVWP